MAAARRACRCRAPAGRTLGTAARARAGSRPRRRSMRPALVGARHAIPIHWGTLYLPGFAAGRWGWGSLGAGDAFALEAADRAPELDVRVLRPGESTESSRPGQGVGLERFRSERSAPVHWVQAGARARPADEIRCPARPPGDAWEDDLPAAAREAIAAVLDPAETVEFVAPAVGSSLVLTQRRLSSSATAPASGRRPGSARSSSVAGWRSGSGRSQQGHHQVGGGHDQPVRSIGAARAGGGFRRRSAAADLRRRLRASV